MSKEEIAKIFFEAMPDNVKIEGTNYVIDWIWEQLAEKDKEIELDKLILDGERVFYKKRIKELEEQLNQKT